MQPQVNQMNIVDNKKRDKKSYKTIQNKVYGHFLVSCWQESTEKQTDIYKMHIDKPQTFWDSWDNIGAFWLITFDLLWERTKIFVRVCIINNVYLNLFCIFLINSEL